MRVEFLNSYIYTCKNFFEIQLENQTDMFNTFEFSRYRFWDQESIFEFS